MSGLLGRSGVRAPAGHRLFRASQVQLTAPLFERPVAPGSFTMGVWGVQAVNFTSPLASARGRWCIGGREIHRGADAHCRSGDCIAARRQRQGR